MKKILFAFWLTLLVGHSARAQIWQAYKGIWLKGYDNATQAPIPPTGYSALTYFADSLGTYVYDWDSLAWLRIPGAGGGGGGGGGLVTADNGLSVNPAGNVRLGGTLTQSTTIQGAGNNLNLGLPTSLLSQFQVVAGTAADNRTGLTLAPTAANLTNVHNGTAGRISGFFLNDNETFLRIDSAGVSATHEVNFWRDKVAYTIEGQRYATIGAANTRFSPTTNFIVNAGSTSGNLSRSTFTPTSLQLAVTDNFSFLNTFDLNATSWNINIPNANFSANPSSARWAQGSGGESTSIELTHATESAELRSTTGSALKFDVSSAGGVDVNSSGSLDLSTPTVRVELQSGVDRVVMRNPGTSTSFIRFDILNNDPEIMLAGSTQSQVSAIAGNTLVVKTRNNGSGANNSGDLHLHTGDVLAGKAGDISIKTGAVSSGTNGNIILDARAGFIIINPVSLPTTNPCGSAPSGTVWSDSGTLKICP